MTDGYHHVFCAVTDTQGTVPCSESALPGLLTPSPAQALCLGPNIPHTGWEDQGYSLRRRKVKPWRKSQSCRPTRPPGRPAGQESHLDSPWSRIADWALGARWTLASLLSWRAFFARVPLSRKEKGCVRQWPLHKQTAPSAVLQHRRRGWGPSHLLPCPQPRENKSGER